MPIAVLIVVAHSDHGVSEFVSRNACLSTVVAHLQAMDVSRVVIESRDDDREDERLLTRARARNIPLVFEHRPGRGEPMLWVADALAWAYGADASWRVRVLALPVAVIELWP
jgi:hypothetical protein